MAQTINVVCDWCDILGMPDVPAVRTRLIALDGPPRRVDVCRRCDVGLESFVELYSRGQDLPSEPVKPVKKPVSGPKASELDTPVEAETAAVRKDLFVICPLSHGQGGEAKRVRYEHRGNHADLVHQAKIWDIAWADPDGILTEPCGAHKECLAGGLKFTTARGRSAHVNSCPLPRIDADG
jgi:hypothetical protein